MSDLKRSAHGIIELPEGGAIQNLEYKQRAIFTSVPTVETQKLPDGNTKVIWRNGPDEWCILIGKLDEGSVPTPLGGGMTSNGFEVKILFFNEKN